MQTQPNNPLDRTDAAAPTLESAALQRRRLLLKAAGKGATVVALAVPIQTLATGGPLADRLCTVSGVQSNVGSGRTGGTTAKCLGYMPSHFATLANWPGYSAATAPPSATFSVGSGSYTDQTFFSTIFGSGSGNKLFDLFTVAGMNASEITWAAALLSAIKKQLAGLGPNAPTAPGYFPYTPEEVVILYKDPLQKGPAEAFFSGYLQGQS